MLVLLDNFLEGLDKLGFVVVALDTTNIAMDDQISDN